MPELKMTDVDEDAILKTVFDIEDIEAKTELTPKQIENVNKVLTLADITGCDILKLHANKFMVLQKSLNRKSLGEFVSVVKARRDDGMNQGKSFFNRMLG